MRDITHFIDGAAVAGTSGRFGDVFNPNTGEVQARVALATAAEVDAAVASAVRAQQVWALVNPQRRARVMFEFKRLIERDMNDLAELLSSEHGKVIADSKGDIQRGLEVIEFACGIPHVLKGEYTEGAGPGIDVYSMRQPLGVAAGITPFNFPAMIPMWMFGIAIAVGNTFILKPSEKDPQRPGPPGRADDGGRRAQGRPERRPRRQGRGPTPSSSIRTSRPSASWARPISPTTSTRTARRPGKRVQAMGGAKNHGIIMPDADLDQAVKDIVGAALRLGRRALHGPAGDRAGRPEDRRGVPAKRCWPRSRPLKVGVSSDPAAQYGPVVSAAHKDKIANYIQMGVDEGAELVVDGRGFALQGYEKGFFIGPSLFDQVKPTMRTYQEEIFGPVLQIVRAETFEDALALPSNHQYGNGVAIFTRNGRAAREFAARSERRHGRHQRADPGAGRLSHLRRLEALGVRRHQPARHGGREVLHQGEDHHRPLARRRPGRFGLRHPDDGVIRSAG